MGTLANDTTWRPIPIPKNTITVCVDVAEGYAVQHAPSRNGGEDLSTRQ